MRRIVTAATSLTVLSLFAASLFTPIPQTAAAASGCGLANAAFCDTFDAPADNSGIVTRSGDLDGVVWGVSRGTNNDAPAGGILQQWSAGDTRTICGITSHYDSHNDVAICNGQLHESVQDDGNFSDLAMYPRQPFDIAGRTGKVVFDVSADSDCSHCAWPVFEFTDQPVPAPYHTSPGLSDKPRNGIGFAIDATPGDCPANSTKIMEMWVTTNYVETFDDFPNSTACVLKPTQPGQLNHFEVDLSQNHITVFATDAGSTQLQKMVDMDIQIPLTRGLLWMEDVHYNACKYSDQCNHTFTWDNFGFDGPVLPRDLGFDVPNASLTNLGYLTGKSLTIKGVHDVEHASGALLEFTGLLREQGTGYSYSFNGHPAHSATRPNVSSQTETFAFEVPLSDLVDGDNTVTINTPDSAQAGGSDVANIDVILVGAGGVVPPSGGGGANPTPVPPTSTPVPPTQTPAPTSTPGTGSASQSGLCTVQIDAKGNVSGTCVPQS